MWNYFRFLNQVFHNLYENFRIKLFCNTINNLEPDLKLISGNPPKFLNFFDIYLQIVKNNLVFDIYYKPTNN